MGLLDKPDVLKRAQADLDAVVKPGHLPDFEDEESLPFITAIVKETLRWRDVVPIGRSVLTPIRKRLMMIYTAIPRLLDYDDEYKGYRVPAGSIIIPNAW